MENHFILASLPAWNISCILLVAILGLCSLIWMIRRGSSFTQKDQLHMPPGPRGLPLIGNLHRLGVLPHQTLAHLSKTYGPLMCVRLGAVPVLVASSPEMAMQLLHTHDKNFAGRPRHVSTANNVFGCPDILFSQPGPYWKHMRQICASDFFSSKRLDHFRPIRAHEMNKLLRSVFAAQGSPVSLREILHTTKSNIISRMALGKPMQELVSANPDSLDIVSILLEIVTLLGVFNVGDYIPSLARMDLQGYENRSKEAARKVSYLLQEIIDARRSCGEQIDGPPCDFLDVLLQLASTRGKHEELQIDDARIRAIILNMWGAATDTSAIATEWALAELLANPEKLRKVQEELDEVVGKSQIVEESDLPNLPYLRAVLIETLRLHPSAPLLIPHMSMEACQIAGYYIPANTVVYINAWAIQRDPSIWENPLEFCPERFLNSNLLEAIPGQHFGYIPFGAGRRSCPGWKLALLNMQNVLANLLHAFNWTIPEGKTPAMNEAFGMVVSLAHPLSAVPMPRLPIALYDKCV